MIMKKIIGILIILILILLFLALVTSNEVLMNVLGVFAAILGAGSLLTVGIFMIMSDDD